MMRAKSALGSDAENLKEMLEKTQASGAMMAASVSSALAAQRVDSRLKDTELTRVVLPHLTVRMPDCPPPVLSGPRRD